MRQAGMVALALAALAGGAAAQEPWSRGEWTLEGRSETRRLEPCEGELALEVDAGDLGRVRVRGPDGPRLALEGERRGTPGLVGALEGREAGPDRRVRVTVERGPATADGEETATATVIVDGRTLRRERWRRFGPAELEIVAAPERYDPVEGPLTVRVRVRGRPQQVTLTVRLPARERGDRVDFYRADGVDPTRVATIGPVVCALGERTFTWDGRDAGRARRLALSGRWQLAVDSPERGAHRPEPATRAFAVPRPRLARYQPDFVGRDEYPDDLFERARSDFMARYTVEPLRRFVGEREFVATLGHAALGMVATHGADAMFSLGDWSAARPMIDHAVLEPGALADVHTLMVFACRSGRATEAPDLGLALLRAGVDVVVTSTETLLIAEARPFYDSMGLRLLGYGHPIERALQDAATHAHDQVWKPATRTDRKLWRALGARPLKQSLRIDTAPGIDLATERLVPARYGRSTN